jgi:hypothetical protein
MKTIFKQQGTGCGVSQFGYGEVQMAVACGKVIGSKRLGTSRLAKKNIAHYRSLFYVSSDDDGYLCWWQVLCTFRLNTTRNLLTSSTTWLCLVIYTKHNDRQGHRLSPCSTPSWMVMLWYSCVPRAEYPLRSLCKFSCATDIPHLLDIMTNRTVGTDVAGNRTAD